MVFIFLESDLTLITVGGLKINCLQLSKYIISEETRARGRGVTKVIDKDKKNKRT